MVDNKGADLSQQSSPFDFSLDVGVELLPADGFGIEATHCVDYFPELVFIVSVFELLVNILEVCDVQFPFALNVQQGEVGLPSLLREWVSLHHTSLTILVVNSLRKPSKSKALPPV